ncbi:MAG: divergent polysaccharide deacetylase family protein [Alphaproteobacteria bacterium]|nr:divergent polysaccharide deacetylase family protein [Alphaproteobacteria bacterium]OJV14219.1 MAG: hypothetical protein BGO27_01815 [Alphaproteobacteria bacterium 33-17]
MLNKLKNILALSFKYLTSAMWILVVLAIIYFYAIEQNNRDDKAEVNSQKVVYDTKEDKFIVFNKAQKKDVSAVQNDNAGDKKSDTVNAQVIDKKVQENTTNQNMQANTPDAATQPATPKVDKVLPKVAFLVVNLGLSESATKMSLSLPPEVAIGISTYSANIPYWENEFANDGHDIFAELPLEPEDYKTEDRGFLSILSYNTNKQNQDNFNAIIKKFSKIIGFYTFGNEIFSSSDKAKTFYKLVKDKGLKVVYGASNIEIDIAKLFRVLGIGFINSPVVLDTEVTEDYINKQLNTLVANAQKNGRAYAIIRPYPISIRLITNWIDKNKKKSDVKIVKITDIIN